MLKHPIFIFQKFHAKLISRFRNATSEAKFRLLSIAVRSDAQSRGIGRKMLDAFEETLNSRGIVCYGLSVRGDNRKAISFYEKNGFFLEKEFPESKYYQKRLNMS
jgi:ribosomal protein S18 acetylase RimI-like enzyme